MTKTITMTPAAARAVCERACAAFPTGDINLPYYELLEALVVLSFTPPSRAPEVFKADTIRPSVVTARELGECCNDDTFGYVIIPQVLAACAVLWQQERALRIEVAKLQERLGIRPDKRNPDQQPTRPLESRLYVDSNDDGGITLHLGTTHAVLPPGSGRMTVAELLCTALEEIALASEGTDRPITLDEIHERDGA